MTDLCGYCERDCVGGLVRIGQELSWTGISIYIYLSISIYVSVYVYVYIHVVSIKRGRQSGQLPLLGIVGHAFGVSGAAVYPLSLSVVGRSSRLV